MTPRLDYFATAPDLIKPLVAAETRLAQSGLDQKLAELVRLRVSQINGCAFCIHMHTHAARRLGESEERMHLVAGWHDSPLFSPRERAALAWAEALTHVSATHAPDADYAALAAAFSPQEQVALTAVIGLINAWNRIAIGFGAVHPVPAVAAG
ncbi:carboxymuconolactone decarboxylase family protein [Paroceanicella profunda]|uniref:Carboxymuconolactone decarboxylase family protein n=1 Tax=Paroceanicella profunda TaxID=2579971 RepID=A0A5B8FVK9_9RHOB|nr:carboxymuconolactone decarboxylase family protein [Paroceanicella profunda]QDL90519.1 carboxymuconolactone decarboxylase family protein [Paroceanicella profunda]